MIFILIVLVWCLFLFCEVWVVFVGFFVVFFFEMFDNFIFNVVLFMIGC